jgi:outer membrane protein assembly factor BamB
VTPVTCSASSGTLLWKVPVGFASTCAIGADGTVYFGSGTSPARVDTRQRLLAL